MESTAIPSTISSLPSENNSFLSSLAKNPIVSAVNDVVTAIQGKRDQLGLSNPGTFEMLARETTKDVFLTDQAFTGVRADITKSFSVNPLFQISHQLSMGSQQLPPYAFATMFGNSNTFMHANLDNDGAVSGRFHYRWAPGFVTKVKTRISSQPGSMVTFENEYQGKDFTAGFTAYNPSVLDGGLTGVYIGNYLQAITPRLSLGLETVWQRQAMSVGPESAVSYVARYATPVWIATGQFQGLNQVHLTYWRKIAEKIEAGADCTLMLAGGRGGGMMGRPGREGLANVGVKYEFRTSVFRTMIDSTGKVSCLLERRLAPTVQMTFYGDMDHSKNSAKLGCMVSLDIAGEELMDQQEKQAAAGAAGGAAPPPF